MAGKKENIKLLFSNTRSRVIIIMTVVILLLAVFIGYVKIKSNQSGPVAEASLKIGPGGIQSIPGALDQTIEYAKLQEQQNIDQAEQAQKTGQSAIPTIIKTQALGQGVIVGEGNRNNTGVGFATLTREEMEGNQHSLWIQNLQNSGCSKSTIKTVLDEGGHLIDLKAGCSCVQLKDNGYTLSELNSVCACKDLKAAGFNTRQLKNIGYSAARLKDCAFNACELRNAGFIAQEMRDAGFTDGELKGAGFNDPEITAAGRLPDGISAGILLHAGCDQASLIKLRSKGVSASALRRYTGCSINQLKNAGFSAKELKNAGFTAAELIKSGFTPVELSAAGYMARDLLNAGLSSDDLKKAGYTEAQIKAAQAELTSGTPAEIIANAHLKGCAPDVLKKAKDLGISAGVIRQTLGCAPNALKIAGYSAENLKDVGFTLAELKNAGFNPLTLKAAGYNAKELKDVGFSAGDLKAAGFTAAELKVAGFSPKEMKEAGFSPAELKAAGYTDLDIKNAGYAPEALRIAGIIDNPNKAPSGFGLGAIPPKNTSPSQEVLSASTQQLQSILSNQNRQMAEQRYQQKIQQRSADLMSAANQALSDWKTGPRQAYITGNNHDDDDKSPENGQGKNGSQWMKNSNNASNSEPTQPPVIKTGDILFAVMDTAVNSDEPGPILATIVSGKLKGAKLIGSFNVTQNASKMVIVFNTMSIPGASRTQGISAYAIDPDTARTALSSKTDHHYLMRYGSLFASSFLQGIGTAFQSADTQVSIGGTGGVTNTTVQNGISRSTLDNAIIAMTNVGQAWGQQVQQVFNTPTTIEVYAGSPLGILFTQDVQIK